MKIYIIYYYLPQIPCLGKMGFLRLDKVFSANQIEGFLNLLYLWNKMMKKTDF